MAVLEEQGYIAQPHTSAGRVPTDKGYRLFVDRLSQVKPLSSAERKAIETFLAGAVDIDDVVMRTVRLLAQLTRQVAVVQYPTLTNSTVRHVARRRRIRFGGQATGPARCAGSDANGLPGHDGRGARGGTLRQPDPGCILRGQLSG
jgi:hypothetical protein